MYRGSALSTYYGHYFFADYCSDRIWTLHDDNGNWVMEDFGHYPGNNFSTFGEDAEGQLYIAGISGGTIYRVISNSTGIPGDEVLPGIRIIQSPFSDRIRIIRAMDHGVPSHLTIFDGKGSRLYDASITGDDYTFDAGFLPPGFYLVAVETDSRRTVLKLIR